MDLTGGVIAILQLSTKVLDYLRDVKGASKDRLQVQIEISNLYALLIRLESQLEEGSAHQPWNTAVQALGVKDGPLDQYNQTLETLKSKTEVKSGLEKARKALTWKFSKEEVADMLQRMENLKSLVNIALQMDHFELSKAIKEDTTCLRTQVPAIQSGVDTIRQQQNSTKHHALLEWLSTSDYPNQQSDIIRRREKGTGDWFLDAPEVSQWLGEAKSTLFCPGIPGAGKTMIAAIAIDHLLNAAQNSGSGIAYVYCNYKTQEEQNVSHMLSALLKQLALGQPSAIEHVDNLHKNHAIRGTRPSLEAVKDALRGVLKHYPYVRIVIDALDESHNATRNQLLQNLRDLQAENDVRLMITARFMPDIETSFKSALRLEVRASTEDVERYVAGQTDRLPRCIQRYAVLQATVQEKISDAVDGMFLLARLHVDSLLDKQTPKAVKKCLANLSKGESALDKAYEEALQRIETQLPGNRELAKLVLLWIIFAKRPLTVAEICCALAVELDKTEIDPENIPDSEDLVSVCAGLVVIDEESAVIRLVHYTTQEYFERNGTTWAPDGQLHIARACLTYLSFDAFQSGLGDSHEEAWEMVRKHRFLEYAAEYWDSHARAVEDDITYQLCTFLNNTSFSCVLDDLWRWQLPRYGVCNTPLHRLAYFGLATTARRMSSTLGCITALTNGKDNWGGTLLFVAATQGHVEMVNLLLEYNTDENAQMFLDSNALQGASAQGHEQIVEILLESGADVNAEYETFGNPLEAASYNGYERIVKMLLDNGADINAQSGSWFSNALHAASCEGHERVVKMLLDNGADVNAQGGHVFCNALEAASVKGHKQAAKILLDHGAEANTQCTSAHCFKNALEGASDYDREDVVKLLLDHGADPDSVRLEHRRCLTKILGQIVARDENQAISSRQASPQPPSDNDDQHPGLQPQPPT